MGAIKMWVIQMRDEQYLSLPFEERQKFVSEKVYYEDEHQQLYENDLVYRKHYKTYRAVKRDLEEYKFNKRHANNSSDTKHV